MRLRILTLLLAAVAVSAVDISSENFDEVTAGKAVFIKFYAPWCGHCKSLKPTWDRLMEEFSEHSHIVVADCDCTAGCKRVCEEMQIQGYPTLKYGDPSALEDYKGARDLESLVKHANSELKPACSLTRTELCDDSQKQLIARLEDMTEAEIDAEIAKGENEIAAAEAHLKTEVEALQAAYSRLQSEKAAAVSEIRSSGLSLMKAVRTAARKARHAMPSEL